MAVSETRPKARGWRTALHELSSLEVLILVTATIFIAVALIGAARVTDWLGVVLNMLLVMALVIAVSWYSARNRSRLKLFRVFYIGGLVPVLFKTTEAISFPIHGRDYDDILIALDRMIFGGVDPT